MWPCASDLWENRHMRVTMRQYSSYDLMYIIPSSHVDLELSIQSIHIPIVCVCACVGVNMGVH